VSSGTEIQLVIDDVGAAETAVTLQDVDLVPAMDRLAVGALRRGAFIDHFLGPETSIGSFARGQYPELGDFAAGAYDVVAPPNGGRPGEVTLGRSAVVNLGEERALLRIEKTYRFDLENPCLTLVHRTANRSRDPASSWFGLEWTFGLPSGQPSAVSLRVQQDSGFQTYRLEDGPTELPASTWFEWEDSAAGLTVLIELDLPHALWWMPVRTVAQAPSGWREDIQGNTLLFHAPTDIWGNEERCFTMRIGFLSGG
jgi:hypothetical protein